MQMKFNNDFIVESWTNAKESKVAKGSSETHKNGLVQNLQYVEEKGGSELETSQTLANR